MELADVVIEADSALFFRQFEFVRVFENWWNAGFGVGFYYELSLTE